MEEPPTVSELDESMTKRKKHKKKKKKKKHKKDKKKQRTQKNKKRKLAAVIEDNNEEQHQASTRAPPEFVPSTLNRKSEPYGRYFPRATKIPGALYEPGDKITILLFYQYVAPLWSDQQKKQCFAECERLGIRCNIGGRLRISREGINATVSGTRAGIAAFCQGLIDWHPVFKQTDFTKQLHDLPREKAFKELSLFPVQEIVHYGISPDEATDISALAGTHLPAREYHKKLQERDTVIIDIRNTYESDIGRFVPPDPERCQWIDPKMRRSTDFQSFLEDPKTQQIVKDKQVLMYCTGGIRCERASAMMMNTMGDKVKAVYQLEGGIEKYIATFGESGFWEGKNFVFDKRGANSVIETFENPLDVSKKELQGTGTGKKKKRKKQPAVTPKLTSAHCCVCLVPEDKYVGRRKCDDCGVPVITCNECRSKRRDVEEGKRCPLCKEAFRYPEIRKQTRGNWKVK